MNRSNQGGVWTGGGCKPQRTSRFDFTSVRITSYAPSNKSARVKLIVPEQEEVTP
jgi:hypothetical protein